MVVRKGTSALENLLPGFVLNLDVRLEGVFEAPVDESKVEVDASAGIVGLLEALKYPELST